MYSFQLSVKKKFHLLAQTFSCQTVNPKVMLSAYYSQIIITSNVCDVLFALLIVQYSMVRPEDLYSQQELLSLDTSGLAGMAIANTRIIFLIRSKIVLLSAQIQWDISEGSGGGTRGPHPFPLFLEKRFFFQKNKTKAAFKSSLPRLDPPLDIH